MFQDKNFVFEDFNGLKLEKLVTCETPTDNDVVMVFIKVENNEWHQFFLDSGYGFWQNYENIDPTLAKNNDDEYNYIEKTLDFNITGKCITKIICEPNEVNSKINIAFETNEHLILRAINPKQFDSKSELVLTKNNTEANSQKLFYHE